MAAASAFLKFFAKSGARLREVGTTNRTRLLDYENAISPDTGMILRVHQSNFSIEGFTERPTLQDLAALGKRKNVPVFNDQGTGLVSSLEDLGVHGEPTLVDSFRLGIDLIAASGDKLLGGPQCGLLIGRVDLIDRIRKNPLLRALRVDKLTYAALEATLMDHLSGKPNPTTTCCTRRHWKFSGGANGLPPRCAPAICCRMKRFRSHSLIGGGTAPAARLQSSAVSLRHATLQPQALLRTLRRLDPPVIGRVYEDAVLLDLRTVEPEFDVKLVSLLRQAAPASTTMTAAVKSVVIGTAGHIDHGKTTLVHALTGVDTDRLPEEKRRGITIDLGFASLDATAADNNPLRISFVDVPGHKLFIRNMLAGAGCVDAVLLVISAEEGVKPQTEEHLAICSLLGVCRGLTVITKVDAVSPDRLAEVSSEIRTFLKGTFLDRNHAGILPVSARTGQGLDDLRHELLSADHEDYGPESAPPSRGSHWIAPS